MIHIDLSAPVVPGKSLGGIEVGNRLRDMQDLIMSPAILTGFELVLPFEARYYLYGGCMSFAVDVRNGRVFKICAGNGYEGRLLDRIHVGMLVRDAAELDSRLYYDEAEEVLLLRGVPGVVLDVPVLDPPAHGVSGMAISSICVSSPFLVTARGQAGDW